MKMKIDDDRDEGDVVEDVNDDDYDDEDDDVDDDDNACAPRRAHELHSEGIELPGLVEAGEGLEVPDGLLHLEEGGQDDERGQEEDLGKEDQIEEKITFLMLLE